MPRITLDQWPKRLEALAVLIGQRWPWLSLSLSNDALHVDEQEVSSVSASVALVFVNTKGHRHLAPAAQITGGGGLIGTLSEVEAGLQSYRAILDALHFAVAQLGNLEVYADGVPCPHCGGTGEIRETVVRKGRREKGKPVKCPRCDGTGKEPTSSAETKET